MSNMQNDIINEAQLEQEYDKKFQLLELEKELSEILVKFANIVLEPGEKVKLQPRIDEIINLFRKHKEAM